MGHPSTEQLLAWYDVERRILPWREDPTPYHVWLSEIMLQQTRVEAVKEYYARFLSRLPDIPALAAAEEDTLLKLWEGLGYYSRIRNMHKAALVVVEQYGGELPSTAAELVKLPGIGEYTSKAIASIAFGEAVSSVDGNLLRVFSRRTCYPKNVKTPEAKRDAEAYFLERIPEDRPGDYNQALMDLGATICLPNGEPLCDRCPWQEICQSHAAGTELDFPVVPPKPGRKAETHTILLVRDETRILLTRRPDKGLLAGLYEFLNFDEKWSRKKATEYAESLGLTITSVQSLPSAKHIFSHKEWHMTGFEIRVDSLDSVSSEPGTPGTPFAASLSEVETMYSIPSAFSAFTRRL
ncbi:MAG: A/G-specific adenine glycosylase [Clostridia bacterium]|nr:A/G-specific adenine glycosylase [Clostridia bacterium]